MNFVDEGKTEQRGRQPRDIARSILEHLTYSVGKDAAHAVTADWVTALSLAIRDRVVDSWISTTRRVYASGQKRVYYLSMEFMIGRLLGDAIANLGIEDATRQAIADLGLDYDQLLAGDVDAALGNGGLGRLAACFMESMSTLGIAAHGYGIRYEHGLFAQRLRDGWQVEEAEDWLTRGHVWEFDRPEVRYTIGFGGHVETDARGRAVWHAADRVLAAAHDTPITGWHGRHINTLRLWTAKPVRLLDLQRFNQGDFLQAAEPAVLAQTISRVLYPDDTTEKGRELRLKQEYFFTSASLQDLLRRYRSEYDELARLAENVAIQLNDTHPALAVPELMRLLVDENGMAMEEAFAVVGRTITYTNHTLLPEALERWPTALLERTLPRHLQIIRWIDDHVAERLAGKLDREAVDAVRIIDHHDGVRMGNLAFIGSRRTNGVSGLHTELMKKTVFRHLHHVFPNRIVNETNGITPRRWLYECNPPLRELLIETIGDRWIADLEQIEDLAPFAEDSEFRHRFAAAKRANKHRLAAEIEGRTGIVVDPEAMFDVQVKRIHEYKRQLLNVLETVALYLRIREEPQAMRTPRVKIFAGKAAPSYTMAKMIIKLINDVADVINNDAAIRDMLKVVFMPNYNVSLAEMIIPAADLSEQISTAGMEASGTGNMKFALNGALTIGTLDGANVEISERVGRDNIFIFGLTADEVEALRAAGYNSRERIAACADLSAAITAIAEGMFSPDDPHRYQMIVDRLHHDDYFLVTGDFEAYHHMQNQIDAAFTRSEEWLRKSVLNTANVGWFSSDRTIRGYAHDIWRVPIGVF